MKPETKSQLYHGLLGAASMIVVMAFVFGLCLLIFTAGRDIGHSECRAQLPSCQ